MNKAFQINKRARAGEGNQWFYGINWQKAAQRRREIEDTAIDGNLNLRAMYDFTEIYLRHAGDLARSGKKDAARNWVRFFENSRVLHVLADAGLEVKSLRASLNEISTTCHPMDVPSWETDIQAIRSTLDEILFHVVKQNSPIDETPGFGGRQSG